MKVISLRRSTVFLLSALPAWLLAVTLAQAQTAPGAPPPPQGSQWENITLAFFADAAPAKPAASGPATAGMQGLFVNPQTGAVYINYSPWNRKIMLKELRLYISKDHGDTWSAVAENPITGRGESGFWCNAAQPFSGKMILWTIDGKSALTADGGATWKAIGKQGRGFDYGDLDWSADQPRTFFAFEHEPYYRVLSTDGGATWKRLNEAADKESFRQNKNWYPRLGVVNATTLVATDGLVDGILYSPDIGATWTKVSDFRPLGAHPIHYGKRLYWAASAGIIVSDNGKDWRLLGGGLPNANWGPYFGASEQEMLVINDKGVQYSRDGAKSWTRLAPPPPGLWLGDTRTGGISFAWDPVNRIVYAAHAKSACYRLRLP